MSKRGHGETTGLMPPGFDLALCTRQFQLRAETINEQNRSVEAVIATEARVTVFDWNSFRLIDEVLIIDGAELPEQLVLLDSHMRWSISDIRGAIRDLRKQRKQVVGRLFFDEDEDSELAWKKARGGSLRDVSVGYTVSRFVDIKPNATEVVDGKKYVAGERTLRVSQLWKPKEGSLVPIGADEAAKIRQLAVRDGLGLPHVLRSQPMAKRQTQDVQTGSFASKLNELLAEHVTASHTRGQVITEMAEAAGVPERAVNELLAGDGEPQEAHLQPFADVLDTEAGELAAAAAADGFDFRIDDTAA